MVLGRLPVPRLPLVSSAGGGGGAARRVVGGGVDDGGKQQHGIGVGGGSTSRPRGGSAKFRVRGIQYDDPSVQSRSSKGSSSKGSKASKGSSSSKKTGSSGRYGGKGGARPAAEKEWVCGCGCESSEKHYGASAPSSPPREVALRMEKLPELPQQRRQQPPEPQEQERQQQRPPRASPQVQGTSTQAGEKKREARRKSATSGTRTANPPGTEAPPMSNQKAEGEIVAPQLRQKQRPRQQQPQKTQQPKNAPRPLVDKPPRNPAADKSQLLPQTQAPRRNREDAPFSHVQRRPEGEHIKTSRPRPQAVASPTRGTRSSPQEKAAARPAAQEKPPLQERRAPPSAGDLQAQQIDQHNTSLAQPRPKKHPQEHFPAKQPSSPIKKKPKKSRPAALEAMKATAEARRRHKKIAEEEAAKAAAARKTQAFAMSSSDLRGSVVASEEVSGMNSPRSSSFPRTSATLESSRTSGWSDSADSVSTSTKQDSHLPGSTGDQDAQDINETAIDEHSRGDNGKPEAKILADRFSSSTQFVPWENVVETAALPQSAAPSSRPSSLLSHRSSSSSSTSPSLATCSSSSSGQASRRSSPSPPGRRPSLSRGRSPPRSWRADLEWRAPPPTREVRRRAFSDSGRGRSSSASLGSFGERSCPARQSTAAKTRGRSPPTKVGAGVGEVGLGGLLWEEEWGLDCTEDSKISFSSGRSTSSWCIDDEQVAQSTSEDYDRADEDEHATPEEREARLLLALLGEDAARNEGNGFECEDSANAATPLASPLLKASISGSTSQQTPERSLETELSTATFQTSNLSVGGLSVQVAAAILRASEEDGNRDEREGSPLSLDVGREEQEDNDDLLLVPFPVHKEDASAADATEARSAPVGQIPSSRSFTAGIQEDSLRSLLEMPASALKTSSKAPMANSAETLLSGASDASSLKGGGESLSASVSWADDVAFVDWQRDTDIPPEAPKWERSVEAAPNHGTDKFAKALPKSMHRSGQTTQVSLLSHDEGGNDDAESAAVMWASLRNILEHCHNKVGRDPWLSLREERSHSASAASLSSSRRRLHARSSASASSMCKSSREMGVQMGSIEDTAAGNEVSNPKKPPLSSVLGSSSRRSMLSRQSNLDMTSSQKMLRGARSQMSLSSVSLLETDDAEGFGSAATVTSSEKGVHQGQSNPISIRPKPKAVFVEQRAADDSQQSFVSDMVDSTSSVWKNEQRRAVASAAAAASAEGVFLPLNKTSSKLAFSVKGSPKGKGEIHPSSLHSKPGARQDNAAGLLGMGSLTNLLAMGQEASSESSLKHLSFTPSMA
eukprot:CAMPEP_0197436054 /NCGR_PEP_ID=MMETSP1175-20131217/3523_1 /TAXON_ID=1003142 /ORGANISM="Triceratium dubium, Strain CCMP147" /LENGTH=1299 /DNA_ID=CAMNT_0042965235 /DNA_START=333 /DNA_END=4232 /DNA_ORIENTATION=+